MPACIHSCLQGRMSSGDERKGKAFVERVKKFALNRCLDKLVYSISRPSRPFYFRCRCCFLAEYPEMQRRRRSWRYTPSRQRMRSLWYLKGLVFGSQRDCTMSQRSSGSGGGGAAAGEGGGGMRCGEHQGG